MFKLIRTQELSEYEGQGLFYRDDRTGMEVFHIKNNSREMSCCFMFQTPSEDSTGVAHILEHTVLCGSKRYPVKDPFSQVLMSSTNTFLNAMTFSDKTLYPFASPLKKDFDILFGIYADAVFAPLLRRESFMQEGIRCFGDCFDGVVFNEMTGALSTEDSVMARSITGALYSGTAYEFESGGDPINITDLTYEEYIKRYRKWYSPSNCRLYFFGDLDASEYMEKIDNLYLKDLSAWDGVKIEGRSADYIKGIPGPVVKNELCGVSGVNSTVVSWLTQPSDDPVQVMILSLLVDILLGNPGAPLYRAITESGLGEDLNPMSGMETELPVMTFTAGFTGVKNHSEEEIESFILSQFESYVRDGLPSDIVEAAIKRMEFSVQEIPGSGTPFGLITALKASRTWLRGGRPEDGVCVVATLEKVKELISAGRCFENWIKENILENRRRACVTVKYGDSFQQARQAVLDAKLKIVQSDESVNWIAQKNSFDSFINTPDSKEALASIERIKRSDFSSDGPRYIHKKRDIGEAKLFCFSQFCRGIVYADISFDTSDLSIEEKRILPVLMRILQMCGTSKKDYSETGTLLKMLTGGFSVSFSCGRRPDSSPVSSIVVRTKMLSQDYEKAISLVGDILLDGNVSDTSRIGSTVTDLITDFDSTFIDYGSSFASLDSASAISATVRENNIVMGPECYIYLSGLRDKCAGDWSSLAVNLLKLRNRLFVQKRMKFHLSCDDKQIEMLGDVTSSFIHRFPDGEFSGPGDFYISVPELPKRRVLCVSDSPAFNAMTVPFGCEDDRTMMGCLVLMNYLSRNYLWNEVRGKGGAYGVDSHLDVQEKLVMFSSYRDPGTEQTYRAFRQSLSSELDAENLEYSVVSLLGKMIRPLSPGEKSREDFRRILYCLDDELFERRRRCILDVKPDDLLNIMETIRVNLDRSSFVTLCGQEMADGLTDFEKIRMPL